MIYLDASALVRLLVEEPESRALLASIEGAGPCVTSVVGEIETVRVARRAGVSPPQVEELRAGLTVLALDDEIRGRAGVAGPPPLRTLDAIHLATAVSLRGELDAVVTYDRRLVEAAEAAGLRVLAPA